MFEGLRGEIGEEQALGFFRIEAKDEFLDVVDRHGSFGLVERMGIALQKIQKVAVVLSSDGRIHAIDSLGHKAIYIGSRHSYKLCRAKRLWLLQILLLNPVVALVCRKSLRVVALKANKDLDYMSELF